MNTISNEANKIDVVNIEKSSTFKAKLLPIVEVFGHTIQGEGPRLRPAIFVRTGLCNFKCTGFGCTRIAPNGETVVGCDTIHAVSPKFKSTWDLYDSVEPLLSRVLSIAEEMQKNNITGELPDIIITGGEPTLHWNNATFQSLLEQLITRGFHVTIETNASRSIDFTEDYQKCVQFSMSVKLSVSGEPEKRRLNFEAINRLIRFGSDSYLKFVVNPDTWDDDFDEIKLIISNLIKIPPVYLMALGETRERQLKNTKFLFDVCAKYGFNFTPRAHILAYDDKDGV